jgi:outer membrane protein OmpA-like peptidoglycan-associated protein
MRIPTVFFLAMLAALAVLPGVSMAQTQDAERRLFGDTELLRARVEAGEGALLSPRHYADGVAALERARADFRAGQDLDRVRARLEDADEDFGTALQTIEVARRSLAAPLKSRAAANDAEAFRLASGDWAEAEGLFNDGARSLEKGSLDRAQRRAAEADAAYRLAELNAIKARYLSEARRLIAEADQARVEKFAPRTLDAARRYLQRADAALDENRYATDEPAALAARAAYEARHAASIANVVKRVDARQISLEELILEWETPLAELATAAGIEPDFASGYGTTADGLRRETERLRALETELEERNRMVLGLEEEIRELDERLGGASAERSALIRRLESQARVREQFASVEALFGPDEAIVLRDGNTLILRLVGLNFPSGSSQLDSRDLRLMQKVQDALDIFPRSTLVVEGHTDTSGAAAANRQLSQARADAVVAYMVETMRVPPTRITSTGYGDTRPIANNTTAEGRARNRRIDLLITPSLDEPF